jgi:hypothetical protein
MSTATPDKAAAPKLEKKPVKFSNLLLGAGLNMFEVTTLGQVNTPATSSSSSLHWLLLDSTSVVKTKQPLRPGNDYRQLPHYLEDNQSC